ncbi:MAG: hypothetical protein WC955_11900 [Elusimicrobiota bacterium]
MKCSNREVAKTFVNSHGNKQTESYHGNMSCEDGMLNSYSTPIAIWSWKLRDMYQDILGPLPGDNSLPDNLIFLTDERYSPTTSKHQGFLRYSANGQVCEIPAEIATIKSGPLQFYDHVKRAKETFETKFKRARLERTREYNLSQVNHCNTLLKMLTPYALAETIKFPERRLNSHVG